MTKTGKKLFHTGTVKKTIKIKNLKRQSLEKNKQYCRIANMVVDVKKTVYLSKKKKNVGTVRLITFTDGNEIEEHVVAWKKGEYFTYIATEGLPLRAYVATISIKPKSKNLVELTWKSYLNSEKMSERQFTEFHGIFRIILLCIT